ncbi:MAG: CapA family protein [Clostridia bacterium]|nr:CapA family protein [Clostridia bacterium]
MNKRLILRIMQIATVLMVLFIVIFMVWLIVSGIDRSFKSRQEKTPEGTEATVVSTPEATGKSAGEDETPDPTANATEPPLTYQDVSLVSVGDALVYASMWESAKAYGGGKYDFSELTKYVQDIVSAADYAVFNLEVNCAGEGEGYRAYPTFNVPDNIVETMKNAGFDGALFANNHTYDTGHNGFMRTQSVLADNGLRVFGARTSTDNKSYGIVDVNGIRLGIINYTYEDGPDEFKQDKTRKYLNWNRVDTADVPLIDGFSTTRLEDFYGEIGGRISELRGEGADFIVAYMHWGTEYDEGADGNQKAIAQRLCDLGVDLLVGGHPHVVQPVATYTSGDGSRRMLCYYSLGNFTSAQNRLTFQSSPSYAWLTENELLANVTIRKYSTGETLIVKAGYTPLWLHRHDVGGRMVFNVVPLDKALASDDAKAAYGLRESSFGEEHAQAALEYIDRMVRQGIAEFNSGIELPYGE